MQKNRLRLRLCRKMLATVILLNFLTPCRGFAEPPTEQEPNSSESETKLYSVSEIETLIEEVSQAAFDAIEQAAGEAAKAATLASFEREAAALREAARWRIEAGIRQETIKATKKAGIKNAVIVGLVCFLGGLAVGIGGTLTITR